jgi:hypothetical protein
VADNILPILVVGLVAMVTGWIGFRLWQRGYHAALLIAAVVCIGVSLLLLRYATGLPGWLDGILPLFAALLIGFGPGLGLVGGIIGGAIMDLRRDGPFRKNHTR